MDFITYHSGNRSLLQIANVCLDTKMLSLSGLEAEILVDKGFYMATNLKIQDGRYDVFAGSYGKVGKFGAFVQNVYIHTKSSAKPPD